MLATFAHSLLGILLVLVYVCTVLEIVFEPQKQKYYGVPGYCINILINIIINI